MSEVYDEEEEAMLRQPMLSAHLLELRQRLIWCLIGVLAAFGACYFFVEDIYAFLVRPLASVLPHGDRTSIYTGLAETFVTYVKLALWSSCLIAFPLIAIQIWRFIAPGLFKEEKKAFAPFLIATPFLFLAGAAMAYGLVMPMAYRFFLSFENPDLGGMSLRLEARVSEYLSMAMSLIFAFGAAFQLPVILVLLIKIGVLSVEKLKSFRRIAIVLIFALAAVLTPPDVISQIMLAVPLCLLYELSIFAGSLVEKKRKALD